MTRSPRRGVTTNRRFWLNGIATVIVRLPKKASKAVVCVRKLSNSTTGLEQTSFGTGFLYQDEADRIWLVSNWHVFTGRRPDEPNQLLGHADSPAIISFSLKNTVTGSFQQLTFPLYDSDGKALWRQHAEGSIFDVAALPVDLDQSWEYETVQTASTSQAGAIEPGFDVILIGFPFPASQDIPLPLWKRGMISSEPSLKMFGQSQYLIDSPGTPGMSGSPVFVSHEAYIETVESLEAQKRIDEGKSFIWEEPNVFDLSRERKTVELEWIGIYAGATGDKRLETVKLGRAHAASAVDALISQGVPGVNPYPPNS